MIGAITGMLPPNPIHTTNVQPSGRPDEPEISRNERPPPQHESSTRRRSLEDLKYFVRNTCERVAMDPRLRQAPCLVASGKSSAAGVVARLDSLV